MNTPWSRLFAKDTEAGAEGGSTPLRMAVQAVLEAAAGHESTEITGELAEALGYVLHQLEEIEQREAWVAIAAGLPEVPSAAGAGLVAVCIGAEVERGLPPETTWAGVRATFVKWCHALETAPEVGEDEDELDDPEPDPLVAHGLELMGQSMVAHLSRSARAMAEARGDAELAALLERKQHLSYGLMWVLELLKKRSGELIVIHVKSRKGFRIAYRNISNGFHLFTLLQGALAWKLPGFRMVNRAAVNCALGQGFYEGSDRAWWHYGRGDTPTRDLSGSIWGEGSPDEIPLIDGEQYILLWPPILKGRSWDTGFLGPHIQAAPASVEIIQRLGAEEVNHRWAKLGLA